VTGSNFELLSGRLAAKLVGRCFEFRVLPFSFSEMLDYYQQNHLVLPADPLGNYLIYGGMPMRFQYTEESDARRYLKSIFDGIVAKDICPEKSRINRDKFLAVANYILANVGKRFSASRVEEYFEKTNISSLPRIMIYRYIRLMEEACLITRVKRFDVASKRSMTMVEKHYAVDPGLRMISLPTSTIGLSEALENVIYNELLLRGYEVYIGKTYKGEIDFVVIKGMKKCFIQVAYLLTGDDVIEREFGAYRSVRDGAPKYVISLDRFDMSRDGIIHLNAEEFLKGERDILLG
jgi:uncharacterized protein